MSNLDTAINVCVALGYKNIKLVGVDLYNPAYFFEDSDNDVYREAVQVRQDIISSHLHKDIKSDKHATASDEIKSLLGNFTIEEFLPMLQKNVLNTLGVSLKVCNPKSLLAARLPTEPIIS